MEATIDDLLAALCNPNKSKDGKLENNAETWRRIGNKDDFLELGLNESEKDAFLKEWAAENPYSNI